VFSALVEADVLHAQMRSRANTAVANRVGGAEVRYATPPSVAPCDWQTHHSISICYCLKENWAHHLAPTPAEKRAALKTLELFCLMAQAAC
jgi:hypothetical protein